MANQLLATFYVQSPEFLYGNVTVTAQIHYQSGNNWYQNTSELTTTVTSAHYEEPDGTQRYRYKVDVFRVETSTWNNNRNVYYYPLHKAGTYKRRLAVTFNNSFTLTRMIFLSIQPELHVYRLGDGSEEQIDLVRTEETVISQNPLHINRAVSLVTDANTLEARNIPITEPNDYKGTVFVTSNLPVDSYSDDVSLEAGGEYNYERWLRLADKIRMTRKIGNSEYKWNDDYGSYPVIRTDTQGKKYVSFISGGDDNYYETALLDYPYYGAVELGLEKPFLDMPIRVEAALELRTRAMPRYTGIGETVENTPLVILPLLVTLKTHHAVTLTPSRIVLNEDNNDTTFATVEANDGADWSFTNVDSRITVTPSSGTGKAAVIIRKASAVELTGNFLNISLTIMSTVDASKHPDIDGEYVVSDSANVHLEKYQPVRNALIPRMADSTAAEGVSIVHMPNDTANELHAEFTSTSSNYASFAINSASDILTIDTGEAVLLDKIEIRGQNVRRLVAPNTYRGGSAVAFSLYGSNDPDSEWTLLRNGGNLTDISAITTTTSTVGSWVWGSTTTTNIVNGFAAQNCPSCGIPLTFCTVCGQVSCPNFDFEEYYNYSNTCSYGHDVWGRHYDLYWNNGSSDSFTPPDYWTTAYRYYRLVPINRSTAGEEMACAIFSIDICKRETAMPVSIPAGNVSDNIGTTATNLVRTFDGNDSSSLSVASNVPI